MKKNMVFGLIIIALFNINLTVFSQKYICQSGETSFFSETPMENISALNKKVVSILDASNGSLVVKMTITDFVFPNRLMQEHFNENYLESEKFPTAVFSGKILESINYSKDGKYDVTGSGSLVIHGTKRETKLKGILQVNGDKLTITASFMIKPEDYNIEIPSLVITKIAEEISVKSTFLYSKSSK